MIKPPNDVYVDNRQNSGRSGRASCSAGPAASCVLSALALIRTTTPWIFHRELREKVISLAMAARQPIDRQAFAIVLLQDLDRTYRAIFAP